MLTLTGPTKMLMIFMDESDKHEHMPLYEAIVRRLRKRECAGATVVRGIMGYGAQHRIYGTSTLGIADNRPVTIILVESEAKINEVLPEISEMVKKGMILTLDAHVHQYTAASSS